MFIYTVNNTHFTFNHEIDNNMQYFIASHYRFAILYYLNFKVYLYAIRTDSRLIILIFSPGNSIFLTYLISNFLFLIFALQYTIYVDITVIKQDTESQNVLSSLNINLIFYTENATTWSITKTLDSTFLSKIREYYVV